MAVEKRDAEVLFEHLHMPADRAARHVKLLGRADVAAVAGGGLEGAKGVERWKAHGELWISFSQP